jgi:hypothetical protein
MGLKAWFASVSKKDKSVRDSGQIGEVGNGNSADLMNTTISGPFVTANLSVFLLHASDCLPLSNFLTLEEALEKEHVVLEETGNVSQLKIKNVGDEVVFIQSGDIVKGGKQDRTLQFDMILPAHSDFVPINSFCVERGRWRKRGNEDVTHFHASNHYLASKPLRMAAKYANSQHEVWNAVSEMQDHSAMNAHVPLSAVQSDESPSSLQLTLDNETIKTATEAYINDLSAVADSANDVVGYAFAINGQVNSIDVYSCNSLFKKMWPKLIHAAAVEAFSELKEGEAFVPATCVDVQACMDDAGKFQAKEQAISGKSKTFMQESPKNVLFETRDMMNGERWVHRNYATK